MPDLADFARLQPDIEMEILSSGELANLTNREADVALRVVYDRKTLPLNLHGLKGPELFGGVYISRDRLAAWRAGTPDPLRWIVISMHGIPDRSEEHTSEHQSLMRISYAVFCLKKKKQTTQK